MAPGTRSQRSAGPSSSTSNTNAATKKVFVVDSDSDSETTNAKTNTAKRSGPARGADNKRQKTEDSMTIDEDIIMLDAAPPTPPASVAQSSSIKNAHLKGRKRFTADFADIKAQGLEVGGLAISKIRPGDDEGMIDLVVVDRANGDKRVVGCNVTITDTSEYPKHHTIITYTDDEDPPERVTSALSALESGPAVPIPEAFERFLLALGGGKPKAAAAPKTKSLAAISGKSKASAIAVSDGSGSEAEEDDDDDDAYDAYFPDDDLHLSATSTSASAAIQAILGRMQRDFVEIVSSSYRPGLIPFVPGLVSKFDPRAGDFALCVSMPVVQLTETIPAQALVAWDRRLLGTPRARHLVLLISGFGSGTPAGSGANCYPPLSAAGVPLRKGLQLRFQVGVCPRYKPARDHALEAGRTFGLVGKDAEDEIREEKERKAKEREAVMMGMDWPVEGEGADEYAGWDNNAAVQEEEDGGEDDGEGRFERFSLSSALENLLDAQLVKLVEIRRAYGVGWAGAETMHAALERDQRGLEEVARVYQAEIQRADKDEAALARTGTLPHDPLRDLGKGEEINLPYTAFCYLVRRLTLCTRYCLVCHNKLTAEYEALKPYVCDRPLCTYQYYAHNRGASLEYEIIHNPETVDLLVSLCYCAAAEGVLDEPLPKGMALRVPPPDKARITTAPTNNYHAYHHGQQPAAAPATPVNYQVGLDGMVEFDQLPVEHMRASIAGLIDTLPPIDEMKRHLQRKVKPGKSKPRLKEMENGTIVPAAWSVLRWCVASCTAYLEEMSGEQCIQGLDPAYRQFRFSVGAPDAEAKFQKALQAATLSDANAKKYPSLFAFHGSALRNWHSIVRHGLWFKTIANGRAFGDGVYLAKEAQTSMSHYAAGGRACWRKSKLGPTSCLALAEIVNLPHKFVSSNPHFVVKDTEWIMCRYLLIKGIEPAATDASAKAKKKKNAIPLVKLDPAQAITLMSKALQVPQPGYEIGELVHQRREELMEEEYDETDTFVFEERKPAAAAAQEVIDISDDEPMLSLLPAKGKGKSKGSSFVAAVSSALKGKGSTSSSSAPKGPPKDDWKHDAEYVRRTVELLMPPPLDSSPSATMAVQRELKTMMKEQEKAMTSAGGLKELGWYMPEEFVGDNLFQWIVEMHSFDESLPIAKDLKREKVNSLIFEIRFPPTYPIGPPFFRIITPRFLPFIQGGGGHITGGGSICMDLLTSDGWLPSYSISAVLMQIKLAISNLDPRPARLAGNWNTPYSVGESLVGFKRAAATHGWTVPEGLDKLVR